MLNSDNAMLLNRSMRRQANDFLHDAMGWQLLSEREEPQFSGENRSCQKSSGGVRDDGNKTGMYVNMVLLRKQRRLTKGG